jgi:hypothetical protein
MSEEQTSEREPAPVAPTPAVFRWGMLFWVIVAAIVVASLVLGVVGAIVWAVAIDQAEEELTPALDDIEQTLDELNTDTDGDGWSDAIDDYPDDPDRYDSLLEGDTDGDGWEDYLDNYPYDPDVF